MSWRRAYATGKTALIVDFIDERAHTRALTSRSSATSAVPAGREVAHEFRMFARRDLGHS